MPYVCLMRKYRDRYRMVAILFLLYRKFLPQRKYATELAHGPRGEQGRKLSCPIEVRREDGFTHGMKSAPGQVLKCKDAVNNYDQRKEG